VVLVDGYPGDVVTVERGLVCEHGYQVAILDGAVRHVSTLGVCLENDAMWRDLRALARANGLDEPTIEAIGIDI
jgi:hypothetical protein